MESNIAHNLTIRYLKRRDAATDAKAVDDRGRRRKAVATAKAEGPVAQTSGRQGPCPVCGRVTRLLRTQVLDADGARLDWICLRCRG